MNPTDDTRETDGQPDDDSTAGTPPESAASSSSADRPRQPAEVQVLQDILAETRKYVNSQKFSDFSIWHLFAGLAQTLVFLALFLWYFQGTDAANNPYLMLAIVLNRRWEVGFI